MSKLLLLKVHRWIALAFSVPLLVIIVTGLILSVEPIFQLQATKAGTVDAGRVVELMKKFDPDGRARGLSIDAARQTLTLQGANLPSIDLRTGEALDRGSALRSVFLWARRTHERLLGQSWLVIASTIAMTPVMLIGILMGLPRFRNTLAGWHRVTAWITLPLIIASPVTGLFMAFGITFQNGPSPARGGRPVPLVEAVRMVAQNHALAKVTSLGSRGGMVMARIFEGGELRAYAIKANGVTPLARNWPRLLHEGNWSAIVAGSLNVVISLALLGLLSTGVLIWARRKLRRPRAQSAGVPQPATR
jgi:uncharacterized iron-regulated membrane protein